jgi:flagellar hook assembly protein FlgD
VTPTPTLSGYQVYLGTNQFETTDGNTLSVRCLLSTSVQVTLKIYNVRGTVIRHLWNETLDAGETNIPWDGVDDQGQKVSTGLYLVTMEAGGQTEIKKVVVIRR